jgi:hypothetical protein
MATTAAVVGTAATIGSSVYGAVKGSKSASQQAHAASSTADAQTMIAAKQAELAQAQWDRYLETFAPFENQLIAEAQQPSSDSSSLMAQIGAINRQYGDAGGNIRAMMGGKNPYGAGVNYGFQRSNELNRFRDVSKAYSDWGQQQQALKQRRLQNMMQVANLGRGLSTGATSGYQGASSAYGNAAGTYGNLASLYNNAAQTAAQGVGNSIGNLYQLYALSNQGGSGYGYDPTLQAMVSGAQYLTH